MTTVEGEPVSETVCSQGEGRGLRPAERCGPLKLTARVGAQGGWLCEGTRAAVIATEAAAATDEGYFGDAFILSSLISDYGGDTPSTPHFHYDE